ncbi:MAG: SAM-dependent methyltransferase [Chloroflexota bacterium]
MITIVGLGPGDPQQITREAWNILSRADQIYVRTRHHPALVDIAQERLVSFDHLYEKHPTFDSVYSAICSALLELAQDVPNVVYAVPGHPLVGEASVLLLLKEAAARATPTRIVEGISFIEPVLSALSLDALDGLLICDALDVASSLHPPFEPDRQVILGQLYDRQIASDVKLTLMNQYPASHPVALVHRAGMPDQTVEWLELYEMDRSPIDHLSSLMITPLEDRCSLSSFQETVAQLRGPEGCPWDQEQTHWSLKDDLAEEAAEVLEAISQQDLELLSEELGDLLFHIIIQCQIAAENGEFTTSDVIAGINSKLIRRHPHVFGDVKVESVEDAIENWQRIKRQEGRGNTSS